MAYRLAQYKAMEESGKYGQFSTCPLPPTTPSPPCPATPATLGPTSLNQSTAEGALSPSFSTEAATFKTQTSGQTFGPTSSTGGARGKPRRAFLRSTRLQSLSSSLRITTSSRQTLAR